MVDVVQIQGLRLAALTQAQVVEQLFEGLARRRGGWLLTANTEYLRQAEHSPALRALFQSADLTVADGMPLLWAARLQGSRLPQRVAGSDLVWSVAERAGREGRSLYLLGGGPDAAEGAAGRLVERWPRLRIAGLSSPRLPPAPRARDVEALAAVLREAAPDIVYVALSTPKQERLIQALRPRFPRIWWIGVGASLGFMSGQLRRAPLWMQRLGLEWLHRLAREPQRLTARYLRDGMPFALRMLAESGWRRG